MTITRLLITAVAAMNMVACATDTATNQQKTTSQSSEASQAKGDRDGKRRRGNGAGQADFAQAAATLGVTPEALRQAMRDAGRPPNFEKAAASLGVSPEALIAALPERRQRPRRPQR